MVGVERSSVDASNWGMGGGHPFYVLSVQAQAKTFTEEKQAPGDLNGRPRRLETSAPWSMPPSALEERFPPTAIIGVPIDRCFEAFLEIVERFPFQLALRER